MGASSNRQTDRARTGFFDAMAPEWDDRYGPEATERIRTWCRSLRLPGNASILDVGCGTGVSSVACAERADTPERVFALDLSRGMLREGYRKRSHNRVHWICGTATEIPLPDQSVDVVLALHVWPHIDDGDAALDEWRRVLRPSGLLYLAHLISRDTVNSRHRSASEVHDDILPPVTDLAHFIENRGFTVTDSEDAERYRISAVRNEEGEIG